MGAQSRTHRLDELEEDPVLLCVKECKVCEGDGSSKQELVHLQVS